jgi:hypothetical protein
MIIGLYVYYRSQNRRRQGKDLSLSVFRSEERVNREQYGGNNKWYDIDHIMN